jgi:DNA-directed RNA polymerase specialized sigma subunit
LKAVIDEHRQVIDGTVFRMIGKASPTVRMRADLLAADAIRSYDPSRKVPLKFWIQQGLQPIRRVARQVTEVVSIPEQVRRESALLMRSKSELRDQLSRDPSPEELADYTHIPVRKHQRLSSGFLYPVSEGSLSAGMEAGDDDADENAPGVIPKDPLAEVHSYLYNDLDDIDKQIFSARTGYRKAPTKSNQELAKNLNLTPGAVSQRASKIDRRMQEALQWL